MSFAHNIAAKGFYLGIVSTTVETNNPEDELVPGLCLLGKVLQKYTFLFFFYMLFMFLFSLLVQDKHFTSILDVMLGTKELKKYKVMPD